MGGAESDLMIFSHKLFVCFPIFIWGILFICLTNSLYSSLSIVTHVQSVDNDDAFNSFEESKMLVLESIVVSMDRFLFHAIISSVNNSSDDIGLHTD